jgi:hypothetical protein
MQFVSSLISQTKDNQKLILKGHQMENHILFNYLLAVPTEMTKIGLL